MANYKILDDLDLIFVNEPLSEKEDKEFSDFLQNRKSKSLPKSKQNQNTQTAVKPKKEELA